MISDYTVWAVDALPVVSDPLYTSPPRGALVGARNKLGTGEPGATGLERARFCACSQQARGYILFW